MASPARSSWRTNTRRRSSFPGVFARRIPASGRPVQALLFALEGANRLDEALAELGVLADTYPGEEGRWRYGALLKRLGRSADAQAVFVRMLRNAERQPPHYREAQHDWLKLARENMQA
jgi:hypothetical protein